MTPHLSEAQTQQFIREGYVVAPGLLTPESVMTTREELLAALEIDLDDPESWQGKTVSADLAAIAATERCRTDAVEAVAEQLVGPHFIRRYCHSPYLESRSVEPSIIAGYIPVLNFPTPGPREFQKPGGYHIDGMHLTTLWPGKFFLVVFAYL